MSTLHQGTLGIGTQLYKTLEGEVPIASLQFYEDNPRIYSLVQSENLTQGEIEEKMCSFDYVKQLAQSIKAVGLVDPIIVRQSDMAVLEGNSRLAAFRMLAKNEPHQFSKIKARLIVDEITDESVDILLGQYHIVGRKDWDPYEQASFMHRQTMRGVSVDQLSESYGLSKSEVKRYISTYEFMVQHNESDPARWSYWDEYLKASKVKAIRKDDDCRDDLDNLVIRLVNNNIIKNANSDMRKINEICKAAENPRRSKIFNSFLDEKISFDEAVEMIESGANASTVIATCKKFRNFISSTDTLDIIQEMRPQDSSACTFELKKIWVALKSIGFS